MAISLVFQCNWWCWYTKTLPNASKTPAKHAKMLQNALKIIFLFCLFLFCYHFICSSPWNFNFFTSLSLFAFCCSAFLQKTFFSSLICSCFLAFYPAFSTYFITSSALPTGQSLNTNPRVRPKPRVMSFSPKMKPHPVPKPHGHVSQFTEHRKGDFRETYVLTGQSSTSSAPSMATQSSRPYPGWQRYQIRLLYLLFWCFAIPFREYTVEIFLTHLYLVYFFYNNSIIFALHAFMHCK